LFMFPLFNFRQLPVELRTYCGLWLCPPLAAVTQDFLSSVPRGEKSENITILFNRHFIDTVEKTMPGHLVSIRRSVRAVGPSRSFVAVAKI